MAQALSEALADRPDEFLFHTDLQTAESRSDFARAVEAALARLLQDSSTEELGLAGTKATTKSSDHQGDLPFTAPDDSPFRAIQKEMAPLLGAGLSDVVNDLFGQCFESPRPRQWNWGYMLPLWIAGLGVRYLVLFPFRLLVLTVSTILFLLHAGFVRMRNNGDVNRGRTAMIWYTRALLFALGAVVMYHGRRPRYRANQVYVANHTTMADFILLLGLHPFSVVGQRHTGLAGFFQDYVFPSLQCLWFDRKKASDRDHVRRSIQAHVSKPDVPPLCIFPEGTCVNNRYCVQFKKGAFDLDGVDVYPVAIRYDESWAVAFWNSRQETFASYVLRLMTSWCFVADVYFMDPERRHPSETAIQFAERVRLRIAERAGLTPVPFDGYLKHVRPGQRYIKGRQKECARSLSRRFNLPGAQASRANSDDGRAEPGTGADGSNGLRRRVPSSS